MVEAIRRIEMRGTERQFRSGNRTGPRWRERMALDSQSEPLPLADDVGLYQPGREPSLLWANWWWIQHLLKWRKLFIHNLANRNKAK
jgi:hypothetical protein